MFFCLLLFLFAVLFVVLFFVVCFVLFLRFVCLVVLFAFCVVCFCFFVSGKGRPRLTLLSSPPCFGTLNATGEKDNVFSIQKEKY